MPQLIDHTYNSTKFNNSIHMSQRKTIFSVPAIEQLAATPERYALTDAEVHNMASSFINNKQL